MQTPTPRKIEWTGPEGWTVWTDEDGTHLRSRSGDCLEACEVESLFALWQHAHDLAAAGQVPAPKPPTREEMRAWDAARAEEYAKRRAVRAVEAEFTPSTTPPF